MSIISVVGKIALEYLRDNPDLPTRTIARMIYGKPENREFFDSVAHARKVLRHYRGSNGKKARKTVQHREFLGATPQRVLVPESKAVSWLPYVIPTSYETVLVLADLHIPYHHKWGIQYALDYARDNGPVSAILLNGDLVDFHMISKFDVEPEKESTKSELETSNCFLDLLEDRFECPIIYKKGNHCFRFARHLMKKSPELWGCVGMTLEEQLLCGQRNIEFVDDQRLMVYGDLNIFHGDELRVNSRINPARDAYMKAGIRVLVSHVHRTHEYTEKLADGRFLTSYSTGCLCSLNLEYARVNKWNLGFAMLRNNKGHVTVDNLWVPDSVAACV